jgi:hypothetical protein
LDSWSDTPFVPLFPCDIIKPLWSDATFYSHEGELFFSTWSAAVAFSAGGDGGRKLRELPA